MCAFGAAIALSCIAWGLWAPLRLFFPCHLEGEFRGYSTEQNAAGKMRIVMTVGTQTLKAAYSPVLMEALQTLEHGVKLRVAQGPHGFIVRVQMLASTQAEAIS